MTRPRSRLAIGALAAVAVAVAALAGCSGAGPAPDTRPGAPADAPRADGTRVAITYDGGVLVLDGTTLETTGEAELDGFLRINGAGDRDGHVFVTAEDGFHVLDTGLASGDVAFTGEVFEAVAAGHATPHAGRTALFDDGTGEVRLFDTDGVGAGTLPAVETIASEEAHHGVAIPLADGTVLSTIGSPDARSGVRHLSAAGEELARHEGCPGVHGEGALQDEVVMFGCEDGVLLFADGAFTKLSAPDAFGRTGNAYVTDASPIAVGDYKTDPDQEGYLLSELVFVDTAAGTLTVADAPAPYTWRGVGRSGHGDVVVLGSDGSLSVLDQTGTVRDSWSVIDAWDSPAAWQDAHPGLRVAGDTAYVTEPEASRVLAVDLHSGEVVAEVTLDVVPNEFVVVGGGEH